MAAGAERLHARPTQHAPGGLGHLGAVAVVDAQEQHAEWLVPVL
jgi:hypothetical protein